MNHPYDRRTFLVGLGIAAGGAGCRLQRAPLAQHTYVLSTPAAEGKIDRRGSGVLLLRSFRVVPAYESRSFVIRRGESEYVVDPYNAFLLSPATMFTETFADWIQQLGVFESVTTGGSHLTATHAVEGRIHQLYGDYRDISQPKACLGLEVRLLHPMTGSSPSVRWRREEHREIPVPRASPEDLVKGWNQAFAEICHSLEPEFLQSPSDRLSGAREAPVNPAPPKGSK